ncbi:DNA polymerase III subunit delta' [Mycoplasma bradburyae]|uniref:DNA polymerase III subunit delta n=1 Tax=Mycoplasma bradburyae TaxID=2963128 RepID=A0AAW6HNI4_9MOLU|nr:DNA polymerase III subunit delta' [Mycoplasma bradburyae]MDC4182523.1 DNA polymerase III subunit delta' [Mycoplasma bradburyae]MDC4183196.1 DNA polymerase III subunit delta' [Mycoplasma bradburyae]MDC4184005.1 DNA polymerase III subunit delta' [Mycoplasma bradburyae]
MDLTNKYTPVLLYENKGCYLEKYLQQYLINIICLEENKPCKKCKWCLKIINNGYYDLIKVYPKNNIIKKQDIINIQNKFSDTALENRGLKIYIINQIEKANKESLNSLLKFLEEPKDNTIGILTTRKPYGILDTIVSRCVRYSTKTYNEKVQFKNNYKPKELKIIKSIFYSYDDILEYESFKDIYKLLDLINLLDIKNKNFDHIMKIRNLFEKLDYYEISLILNYLIFTGDFNKKNKLIPILDNLNLNLSKNAILLSILD